jgi:hypothetical protein
MRRLVREQVGNVETRVQDSMVFHTEYDIIFDEVPGKHSSAEFPDLTRMAGRYLAVPATSVSP